MTPADRKQLVDFGPPNEWSGGVASALGEERRKRLQAAWRAASKDERAQIKAEFKEGFDKHVRAVRREPPAPRWSGPIKVQSVLLPKERHPTEASARAWAKANDFKYGKIEEQANFWRLVQAPSCACSRGTIRTTTFSEEKNIKATVCLPRRGVPFTLKTPCKKRR